MTERKRIFGVENELLPIKFSTKKGKPRFLDPFMGPTDTYKILAKKIIDEIFKSTSKMSVLDLPDYFFIHENQLLAYIDAELLEITTSECLSPRQLVLYDKEMERIVCDTIKKINTKEKGGCVISIMKNNYGFSYVERSREGAFLSTQGTHENYSIINNGKPKVRNIEGWLKNRHQLLASFLVSRTIICGNGCIFGLTPQSRDCAFIFSQRANFIDKYRSCATRSQVYIEEGSNYKGSAHSNGKNQEKITIKNHRSLINLKDEHLGDAKKNFRLHLICGDANLAEWSTYLKFGITGIFLSMLESGLIALKKNKGIYISDKNIVNVFHDVASDINYKNKKIRIIGGKKISALEHQTLIYELAQEYFRQTVPCEWEKDIMKKWGYVLSRLEAGDINSLSDKLDWAIKLKYLNLFMKKHNITSYSDPRVRMMDFQYHELHPERSIFKKLQDRGKIQTILTQEEREFAKNNPPPTRALWRKVIAEKLIQRQMQLFGRVKYEIFSDWEEIWCNYRIQIICRDPFVEDLDEILAYQIATIAQLKKAQFEELGIIILEKKDQ